MINSDFRYKGQRYQLDLEISKGECIGIYVDDHMTAGSACHGIFNGSTVMQRGKSFLHGKRAGIQKVEEWLQQSCVIIDKHRFTEKALTVQDYVIALDANQHIYTITDRQKKMYEKSTADMMQRMGLRLDWKQSLAVLPILDYYKLSLFKAWFAGSEIIVVDRLTEILREPDVVEFMKCVQVLQEQGIAVVLLDMDEDYMFAYADHIDVVREQQLCYHLYPEEYGDKLFQVLGWEQERSGLQSGQGGKEDSHTMLSVRGFTLSGLSPMNFEIRAGEIAFLQDDNYRTGSSVRACFLDHIGWQAGSLQLNRKYLDRYDLRRYLGKKIAVQTAMPDRQGGVLFDNLTALENLTLGLLPKAGKRLMRKRMIQNILQEASAVFSEKELMKPLSEWPMAERLRLSYYKWYLLRPDLLICLFPFAGQESIHREMIIDMLVQCARRGMAVWMVSSNIDVICEGTENLEFLERLRFLAP